MAVPHPQGHQEVGHFKCSGSDRLLHIDDISTLKSTSVPISIPITAQSIPRLEKISEAFQRVKYRSLKFRVVPQISTATSGGYVCAFVSDVGDNVNSSEYGLSKLTSQAGAQTKKWWETATCVSCLSGDLLYTSFSIEDPRLSSPGRFVLGVDGRASQKGSLTVFLDWDVDLSVPSLEGPEQEESKIPTLSLSLWTKAGDQGLFFLKNPTDYGSLDQNARVGIASPQPNSYFRLSTPRGFVENKNNSAGQFRAFNVVYIDPDFKMWPTNVEESKMTELSYGHTLIAATSENIEWTDKGTALKNFHRGSLYLSHVPTWMPLEEFQNVSFEGLKKSCIMDPARTSSLGSSLKECQTSPKSSDLEMLSAFQELLKDSFRDS